MLPRTRTAKILYLILTVIAVALLGGCVAITVWARTSADSTEDGWISANVVMLLSWLFCLPVITGPLWWSLGLRLASRMTTQHETSRSPREVPRPQREPSRKQ